MDTFDEEEDEEDDDDVDDDSLVCRTSSRSSVRKILTIATKSDPKQSEPREVVSDRRNPDSVKNSVHQDAFPLPFSPSFSASMDERAESSN